MNIAARLLSVNCAIITPTLTNYFILFRRFTKQNLIYGQVYFFNLTALIGKDNNCILAFQVPPDPITKTGPTSGMFYNIRFTTPIKPSPTIPFK